MTTPTPGLNQLTEWLVVRLLKRIPYGAPLSQSFYVGIRTLVPQTSIEAVALRRLGERIEVLLTQRPENDPWWPREWHSPGTMRRTSDTSSRRSLRTGEPAIGYAPAAFNRIARKELEIEGFSGSPIFVGTVPMAFRQGPIDGLVFVCQIEGEPRNGKFFNIRNLPPTGGGPEHLMEFHDHIIELASNHFAQM